MTEDEKKLHNLIVERWIEDYGNPRERREFDAYTVSGFISCLLKDYCITIEEKISQ